MAKGSLVVHRQNQHSVEKLSLGQEGNKEAGREEPRTYRMAFPEKAGPRPFPVEGCSGRGVYFWNRHVRDTVVILEEVNSPHPWYPMCDILLLWRALNGTQ